MMERIGLQLILNFIAISFVCFGCDNNCIQDELPVKMEKESNDFATIDTFTIKGVFQREFCERKGYSLCHDGIGQLFRLSHLIIKLDNAKSLYENYEEGVYMTYKPNHVLTALDDKNISYERGYDLDSRFDELTTNKTLQIKCKCLSKKIKNSLNVPFSGFEYQTLYLEMKCVKGGRTYQIMPQNCEGKSIVGYLPCNRNYIIGIDSLSVLP